MGLLGLAAAYVGTAFSTLQRIIWFLFGALYVVLGSLYALGKARWLSGNLGPSLATVSERTGSATLGIPFALNIPACATPLLIAVMAARKISRYSYGKMLQNITLAFLFNGIGIPLAATGLVDPVWAMAAMAVSVTAIFLNSLWGRASLFFDAVLSVVRPHMD